MSKTYEIIQGLAQAAANSFDGAVDEKGKPLKIGLKREEGSPLLSSRTMDGFGVSFYGDKMCLNYQSEVSLKEVITTDFEGEMEKRVSDISSFLQKEYKRITGKSVSLKPEGEIDVLVQNLSRQRSFVTAKMHYKIGGIDSLPIIGEATEDQVASGWEKFLSQGGLGTRPPNDKRKKENVKK